MKYYPITKVITADGSVAPGMRHIEFILSADFAGTINGAAFAGTGGAGAPAVGVYGIDAPPGGELAGMNYSISAGGAILTTF
jgi:hypothetical protein